MSDNLRRYRAICHALTQAYPAQPTGNVARALADPRGAHQWHHGQHEHAAASHRRESTQRNQTRKPCQTLCEVVRQRPHPGGGVFSPLCGRLAASSRLADVGARHGWQQRGPRVHRSETPVVSCVLALAPSGLLQEILVSTTLLLSGRNHAAGILAPPGSVPLLAETHAGSLLTCWRGFRQVRCTPYRLSPTGEQQPISWAFAQCQGLGLTLARPVRC